MPDLPHSLPGSFLDRVGPGSATDLLSLGREQTFRPGDNLTRQGGLQTDVYLLHRASPEVSACVKVTSVTRNGTETLLAIRAAGDLIGECAALRGDGDGVRPDRRPGHRQQTLRRLPRRPPGHLAATTFTLHATFLCTVHDPVAVVRTGGHHAETMLSGYLGAYHQMFEAGLDFALRQVNDARRKLSALVRAYTMVSPPRFTGMTAALANVEVSTPDEVARFQESLRGEHHRHKVDMARQRHEQALAAAARDYERDQLRSVSNAISDDPIAALTLSYTAGDITAIELATALLDTVPVQLDKLVNDFLGTPAWRSWNRHPKTRRSAWRTPTDLHKFFNGSP